MTDIGCVCDGEAADVCSSKVVTARKQYTCCECEETIERGEKYEYISILWEGSWNHFRTCTICVRIRDDLCACCYVFGELHETLKELHGVDLKKKIKKGLYIERPNCEHWALRSEQTSLH